MGEIVRIGSGICVKLLRTLIPFFGQHETFAVTGAAFLLGLLLLGATFCGWLAHTLRAPRVVGFLLAGAVIKLVLDQIFPVDTEPTHFLVDSAEMLKPIKTLALGLILFSIGGVFEAKHLRAVGRSVFTMVVGESGLTVVLVTGAVALAVLAVGVEIDTSTALCLALLLGLAAQATAPAATLFVLREYDAKGPVTDTTLSLVGINNVLCIVTFHVGFMILAASGALGAATAIAPGELWLYLPSSLLGSVLLGLATGLLISVIHAKLSSAETAGLLLAGLLILGAGEQWLLEMDRPAYNFLLTCICAGAVFANVAIDPDRLDNTLRTVGGPILLGFFVLAGFDLHLDELLNLGWVGMAYVLARTTGKILGTWLGLRRTKRQAELRPYLGAALLCQAAVVIGLADFVERHWVEGTTVTGEMVVNPIEWARSSFITTVLGSVAIFELCGSLLIKWVVVRAGEVKAVTLLRRTGATDVGQDSVVALTLAALRRTLGFGRSQSATDVESLRVQHLMRTNIKTLSASAGFDEVLHFIEQSRHNSFPVVNENNEFVGVIRYRDIREMMYDSALSNLVTAFDLANADFPTVTVDLPLEEALQLFRDRDVGLIPVVEQTDPKRVIGILEQRDLLRALHLRRA